MFCPRAGSLVSALLSVVDSGLTHDDALGVEGEPIGFGEETSANRAARTGWRVSEDKLSEKEPWLEWYRRPKQRSGDTWAIISVHIQIQLPEVWF